MWSFFTKRKSVKAINDDVTKRRAVVAHVKSVAEKNEYGYYYLFGTNINCVFECIPEKVWLLSTTLLCKLVTMIARKKGQCRKLERVWEDFLKQYGETEATIAEGILITEKQLEEEETKNVEDRKKTEEEERKIGITPKMSSEQRFEIRHKIKLDAELAELKNMGDEKLGDYAKRLERECRSWEKTLQNNNKIIEDASTCPVLAACGTRGAQAMSTAQKMIVGEGSVVGQRENETLRKYCKQLIIKESRLAGDDWYFSLWLHTF